VRDRLHQFLDFRFEKAVRNDQRADGRTEVAIARDDRLIDGGLQFGSVVFVLSRFRRHDAVPDRSARPNVLILFYRSQAAVLNGAPHASRRTFRTPQREVVRHGRAVGERKRRRSSTG
jgi:hypothetical protein